MIQEEIAVAAEQSAEAEEVVTAVEQEPAQEPSVRMIQRSGPLGNYVVKCTRGLKS